MRPGKIALVAAGALAGAGVWWRRNPSACPYGQRFWLAPPRPLITRARLREILEPRPGERVLEVGPGTGYYALPAAEWLRPGGTLVGLDVQQEMVDHIARRASELGLDNVELHVGDARRMPFDGDSFDAAYLVTVLGEVPDQSAALAELRRVLRPGGRLVVGELAGDPHMVRLSALRERAERVGLRYERRLGSPLAYFARFTAG